MTSPSISSYLKNKLSPALKNSSTSTQPGSIIPFPFSFPNPTLTYLNHLDVLMPLMAFRQPCRTWRLLPLKLFELQKEPCQLLTFAHTNRCFDCCGNYWILLISRGTSSWPFYTKMPKAFGKTGETCAIALGSCFHSKENYIIQYKVK